MGAISEQIEDGVTGFLIPAGDTAAFAEKIREVSRYTPERLEEFSRRAYEFGFSQYAAQAVCGQFLDTILGLSK